MGESCFILLVGFQNGISLPSCNADQLSHRLPHFDIDAVYGPAMHLEDLIWHPGLIWLLHKLGEVLHLSPLVFQSLR